MNARAVLAAILALLPLPGFAGEFDLNCVSVHNCLSGFGCGDGTGETLYVREDAPGKPVLYWTKEAIFSAEIERNGSMVTLAAQGNGASENSSVIMLVLSAGTEAVFATAAHTDNIGFTWTRHQMTCRKVTA